jgi:BMFP domain-containing protein YqiC
LRVGNEREQIQELEARIADLEARLPEHSVPPSMLIQLEELEERLEEALEGAKEDPTAEDDA